MEEPGYLTIEETASRLGLHYMTVYRYVRIGRLPAEYRQGRWQISSEVVTQVAAGAHPKPEPTSGAGRDPVGRLLDRLVAGDGPGSWSIVEAALTAGSPSRIYTELLAPALRTLGEEWAAGRYSVADEHRATTVALGIVGRLGPLFRRRGRRRPGQVLLAGVEGDSHAIPLTMVADSLTAGGFEVIHLGADVPTTELVAVAAANPGLRSVGLSAGTDASAERAAAAIAGLRERVGGLRVVVGGPAVTGEQAARALGADGWAADAVAAVEVIASMGGQR